MDKKKKCGKSNRNIYDRSEFSNLYEKEFESDVTLVVGRKGCQERVPAHSWVLASGSDVFKSLFHEHWAPTARAEKHFEYDNPNGFNNLIRWLYQNKCDLQSLQTSLDTLTVAIKYLCEDLAERCIIQLTTQLKADNVLQVIQWIYCYCPQDNCPLPSAPCLEDIEDTEVQKDTVMPSSPDPTLNCQILMNECFDLIDKNTEEVLKSEYFINADVPILKVMLKRNTLNVSSELNIIRALYKWSTATCKRNLLPLTLENRRDVLGPLLYLTRFLTLSIPEVEILTTKQDDTLRLLTDQELIFVDSYVKRIPLPPVPDTMNNHISHMSHCRSKQDKEDISNALVVNSKGKKKRGFRKKFNKEELILDLVSFLGLIFD